MGFTVDAFPDRQFRGKVQQVRLSATNTSNVITYPVVVAVDNADQSLLPGMTANAEIEVSHRDNVLRVSNAALRYKPDENDAGATEQGGRGNYAQDFQRIARRLELNAGQQSAFDQVIAAIKAMLDENQKAQWDKEVAALLGSRRAPLYKLVDGKPKAATVRVGASDGTLTEVAGDIREGEEVVVGSGRSVQ